MYADMKDSLAPEPATRSFGPFLEVPTDEIKRAGFGCLRCKQPVEVLRKVLPGVMPRMIFHSCRCEYTTVTWEDEAVPRTARDWLVAVKVMRRARVRILVINQGRELSPGFSGLS
jgi:hypothetical protein